MAKKTYTLQFILFLFGSLTLTSYAQEQLDTVPQRDSLDLEDFSVILEDGRRDTIRVLNSRPEVGPRNIFSIRAIPFTVSAASVRYPMRYEAAWEHQFRNPKYIAQARFVSPPYWEYKYLGDNFGETKRLLQLEAEVKLSVVFGKKAVRKYRMLPLRSAPDAEKRIFQFVGVQWPYLIERRGRFGVMEKRVRFEPRYHRFQINVEYKSLQQWIFFAGFEREIKMSMEVEGSLTEKKQHFNKLQWYADLLIAPVQINHKYQYYSPYTQYTVWQYEGESATPFSEQYGLRAGFNMMYYNGGLGPLGIYWGMEYAFFPGASGYKDEFAFMKVGLMIIGKRWKRPPVVNL